MTEDRGTFLRYIDKRLGEDAQQIVGTCNHIITEYEAQGLDLTLRQLYYQFVARGLLPNSDKSYKRLGSIVSDGRLAGLISWTAINDRTRNLRGLESYTSPRDVLKVAAAGYRRDLWVDQEWRPEIWIEKEALVGVVQGICNELRVDFFACRGYNSQSEQWRAGQRLARYIHDGQRPIVFHLGDHDPSGIDMTRDNQERLSMFAGTQVIVQRLALNMSQVEELRPPPNPAKLSDARAADYVARFGYQSWELDALDPRYIRDLIDGAVSRIRDEEAWSSSLSREVGDIQRLEQMIETFD
jgi:hypothetical protein